MEFSALISWLKEEAEAMKASHFSDAQKAFLLKQGDEGVPVAEIRSKAGISQKTLGPALEAQTGGLGDRAGSRSLYR